jgi:hypothetical protein
MPGIWSTPNQDAPFNIGTVLLLTDGSLFAQDDFTVNWWRLRPDAAGSYSSGTWTPVAPAARRRLYFASAVLADGRVFVAGGEYGDDANKAADLLAAEIYDPVADAWTDLPVPEAWTVIGDAPCCVLPDGTVLVGNILTGQCAIFDPALNAWRQTATKLNGSASEESWVLLGDGSVLAIDCNDHPRTERFSGGQWLAAPPIPAADDLVEDVSKEIGPAILRPDGTVFALGATGKTAIFTAGGAGSWAAGPPMPLLAGEQYVAKDAPACLMPDGSVLCVGGAVDGTTDSYGANCVFFEFDGTALTQLPNQPDNATVAPYSTRLLLLPTGQAFFTNSGPKACFFTSSGAAIANGRPEITQVPRQIAPGQSYLLRGHLLNGLSQACGYGDDASMATNYPLVRLISTGAVPTVTYCRTYGHSTMGVATGRTEQNTMFTVPAGTVPGDYEMELVANGIASSRLAITVIIAPPQPATVAMTKDRQIIDNVFQSDMFYRDLNEVHLLADFISGRADKSLTDMNDVPNPDAGGNTTLTAQQALNRVGQIRFPPVGPPEVQAAQAALLLLVKDRLNGLAYPARGISVAFTSMYAGVGMADDPPGPAASKNTMTRISRWFKRDVSKARAQPETSAPASPPRSGFAVAAYPNLSVEAKKFRASMGKLPRITIWFLVATVLLSCDVFICSETLKQATAVPNDIVNDITCNIIPSGDPNLLSISGTPPTPILAACKMLLAQEQIGDTGTFANEWGRQGVYSLFIGWKFFLHPIGWIVKMFGPAAALSHPASPPAACDTLNQCDREAAIAAFAATVVNMFSNAILPVLFGLLGTLSGIMRSVVIKVRDSTLSPRDVRLTWSLLPLGMVAGLTVGLIISPNAATSNAGAGFVLSAASLSFLAGYGADGYFAMLDAVLTRIFPTTPPKP